MAVKIPKVDPRAPAIVIDIGNSTVTVATWHNEQVKTPLSVPMDDMSKFGEVLEAHCRDCPTGRPAACVIGSVVPAALERIRAFVGDKLNKDPLVVGEKVALPIDVECEQPETVGIDRICSAGAAYDRLQTACIVVDFGSAVTVDLISDDGALIGGAIFPGPRMQLRALHEYTAGLPAVEPAFPESVYGRNTVEAMQTGVCRGVAGAVRNLVEGYATALNRWPQVLATGGDLELMMPHCDFLDTPVQHLVLRGIGVAYTRHIAQAMGV
jgi:type III pantothenate kinase